MAATERQLEALRIYRETNSLRETAKLMGIAYSAAQRLVKRAERWKNAPEGQKAAVEASGLDLTTAKHGWRVIQHEDGSRDSVFWVAEGEQVNLVDAMTDALSSLPRLEPIEPVRTDFDDDLAAFIRLADLHVGGQYGSSRLEDDFRAAVDDMFPRLPRAKKAFIMEMGDLLDANDHKGVTPASGNNCDVIRENSLTNAQTAVRMLDHAMQRGLETHQEVELHLIPGNHDPTAYLAVMMALGERYADNPRVNVVVSDAEFRVVAWGKCADFPHHGDKAKWPELKDVFADQFPKAWSAASVYRQISTAHFHHDRARDMVGAVGKHYRTLAQPNRWARQLGMFSRGSLVAETWHKDLGVRGTTQCDVIRPTLEDLAG